MPDEQDLLTCEDTCDDWFQESQNDQDRTCAILVCERVQPTEPPTACSIRDESHRWPNAFPLKLADEAREANRRFGP